MSTQEPTEYDAILRKLLNSPNIEVQIAGISEALKYGDTGFDLIVELLQNESIDPTVISVASICISKALRETVITKDFGWYLLGYPHSNDPNDTLWIACNKLLARIKNTYNQEWFFGGDSQSIWFSPGNWNEIDKNDIKYLPLNPLFTILSAEKLRRQIILELGQDYNYASNSYAEEVTRRNIPQPLKDRILNQGLHRSLLPIFEELLGV
ncbi:MULTISPECIES: hypothetical protein [unclassified Microcoleus]|uniref:hypothetical protein n=1 Tax=unclassified Microcoleus TaxID=2642155 RepID=UPI002FD5B37C